MAATVSVKQVVGAGGGSATTITNLRFSTNDTINPGTTAPLIKPSAGTNRSFWKTVYLNADTSPSNFINNVKIYCDGAIGWTGCTLFIGSTGTYNQATGTEGLTGNDSSVATADMSQFTAGGPKSLTGEMLNPSTGKISDYVIMQIDVATSAVVGTLSPETLTFQYDEA